MDYDNWKTCSPEDESDNRMTKNWEEEDEERAELEFQEVRNTILEREEELHSIAFEIDYPGKSSLDAKLVVGTYVNEFKREASCILTEHSQQFQDDPETGCGTWPQPLFEDEGENPVDLETSTRHELMKLARDLGLKYTRTITKVKLIEMLENS